jgi:phosphomannomutase
MSSTRALHDVTRSYSCNYKASAVGEVNVVQLMKETNAIVGGEGNGGIIYPELHYGRDALVGIALFLTHLALKGIKCSQLREQYPDYVISKNKLELVAGIDIDAILKKIEENYKQWPVSTIDGVKIDFENGWVHLRKSNTEPIIRVYAEGRTSEIASQYAAEVIEKLKLLL